VAAAGKQGQVLIVGTDLIEEAKEAIRDGRLAGSVAFSPYMEGIISAHFALLALQDKPIDKVHIVSVLVTIDNIDEMADWK
jgi:ABC-type sugar transport system substrate-binding protein